VNIKIASWNIAGGHSISSLQQFDYSPEDLDYFIEQLRSINADIVCLQESHTSEDGSNSNAHAIAAALGYPHLLNSPSSPSHIEEGYKLSTAILSKVPFLEKRAVLYPYPSAPLFWRDGRAAVGRHEKNLQVVRTENFSIANNQMLPIHLFSLSYDDKGEGGKLAHRINETMAASVASPVLWCGDFNFENPLSIYPHLNTLHLTEALPDKDTRPSVGGAKRRTDHIFYSPEFRLIASDVMTVNADHYLCWAEFELK